MDTAIMRAFSLEGQVAVVTGAASGIGREIAVVLAGAGARLVLADVDEAGLAATAQSLPGAAIRIADMSDRQAVVALADAARAMGAVGAWINAAGILVHRSILDADEEEFDRVQAVNLKGSYWGCQQAARVMVPAGRGAIVNIASAGADMPVPGFSAYAISKGGVNMLTRTAAAEFGPMGIRVNSIAPGYVETPMVAAAYRNADGTVDEVARADMHRRRAEGNPLGVVGQPRDIALAALYLVSDAARFVTGQVIRPNGGAVMP